MKADLTCTSRETLLHLGTVASETTTTTAHRGVDKDAYEFLLLGGSLVPRKNVEILRREAKIL